MSSESYRSLLIRSLKLIRERHGINKSELARRLGISHSTVVRLERRTANPGAGTVDKYIGAAGAGVDELFEVMKELSEE